jgi:hypothetical protein
MICPSCKCEYIRGVTQCADCGVPLVDALEPSTAPTPDDTSLVAIWTGDDPAECAAAKEALTKAEIPFVDQSSDAYIILRSMRPKTEIFVPVGEAERARKALIDLPGSTDLAQLTPEEIASLALPESEGIDPDETEADPAEPAEDWDDQENVSEVWAGESEDLANNLAMSLRENGISAHLTVEGSQRRLVVHPDKETRAKEIVREVVEASPPE